MIRTVVWSVLYWFGAMLVLVGFVVTLGDCGTAETEREVQQCAEGHHYAFWAVLLLAAALYAFLLWRRHKGNRVS